MKIRTLLAAGLLLIAGCDNLIKPDSGYYTLDLERSQLCYTDRIRCLNLELIIPSFYEHEIARAYGLPYTSESWNVSQLVELMLVPPNKLYEVKAVDEKHFLLPRNHATNTVWRYLKQEQYELYERNGRKDKWPLSLRGEIE